MTKDISQDVMIDVAGNAIDLRGVDHHRVGAGFDRCVECRQEIFPQIIFRDPGGGAVATAQRKTVAHVMFQAGSHMVLRADIRTFETTYESYAHYFCKVGIFTERFVEAWPDRLAPNIEHR